MASKTTERKIVTLKKWAQIAVEGGQKVLIYLADKRLYIARTEVALAVASPAIVP